MAKRQALVAVKDEFEGPWQIARGREQSYAIVGLGKGESVSLQYIVDHGYTTTNVNHDSNGRFPFPIFCRRFRFVKTAGGISPTSVTVEMK